MAWKLLDRRFSRHRNCSILGTGTQPSHSDLRHATLEADASTEHHPLRVGEVATHCPQPSSAPSPPPAHQAGSDSVLGGWGDRPCQSFDSVSVPKWRTRRPGERAQGGQPAHGRGTSPLHRQKPEVAQMSNCSVWGSTSINSRNRRWGAHRTTIRPHVAVRVWANTRVLSSTNCGANLIEVRPVLERVDTGAAHAVTPNCASLKGTVTGETVHVHVGRFSQVKVVEAVWQTQRLKDRRFHNVAEISETTSTSFPRLPRSSLRNCPLSYLVFPPVYTGKICAVVASVSAIRELREPEGDNAGDRTQRSFWRSTRERCRAITRCSSD